MFPAILAAIVLDEMEAVEERARLKAIKKHLRDISDPFRIDGEYFRKHYRLTPHLAVELIEMLEYHVDKQRKSAIPFHLQVLAVLRFLAEGGLQKGVASEFFHPMGQSTLSRTIDRVLDAIMQVQATWIRFPNNQEERDNVSAGFRWTMRIPGILGAIDCFLVTMERPVQNEEAFHNYKVGSSLNVQVVADANYKILNICIAAGSNTDQFVWNNSDFKDYFQSLRDDNDIVQTEGNFYLLADSGYSQSPILLTPIVNAPEGSADAEYTHEQVGTRCIIEQTFGIFTNIWRCLSRSRKLLYRPEKIAKIITCCGVLHNFRMAHGAPYHEDDEDGGDGYHVLDYINFDDNANDYRAGVNERAALINQYYGHQ